MTPLVMRSSLIRKPTDPSVTKAPSCPCLTDQTALQRTGLRGPNAETLLNELGLPVPAKPNLCVALDSGELLLRLSNNEFWLLTLSAKQSPVLDNLTAHMNAYMSDKAKHGIYPLYCQHSHAQLLMQGTKLATIMAKICGVDLRCDVFPRGAIAQTSVARVNAIVLRHSGLTEAQEEFIILSDVTSSEYLWEAVLDAMEEFV